MVEGVWAKCFTLLCFCLCVYKRDKEGDRERVLRARSTWDWVKEIKETFLVGSITWRRREKPRKQEGKFRRERRTGYTSSPTPNPLYTTKQPSFARHILFPRFPRSRSFFSPPPRPLPSLAPSATLLVGRRALKYLADNIIERKPVLCALASPAPQQLDDHVEDDDAADDDDALRLYVLQRKRTRVGGRGERSCGGKTKREKGF